MNTGACIDHLADATTERDLMELFPHGNVAQVNVPLDRNNGRPRGLGKAG